MYRKNRIPMYEGDGFIHSSPSRDNFQNPSVEAAPRNPGSQAKLRPGLAAAARELLHKLAVWIRSRRAAPERESARELALSRLTAKTDFEKPFKLPG